MTSTGSKILVTGAAGFIGFHMTQRLLSEGFAVVGLDNLNAYYDPRLKKARLDRLRGDPGFSFEKVDLADRQAMEGVFARVKPTIVIHLAAQAGVRYSITNPHAYTESNLTGFINILEGCRHGQVRHLVYASSSSVYGLNRRMPFSVHDNVDHPVSLYAATKKANELMAHTYSHLYSIPTTGLRFFTVYGPWGRPDMAYFSFSRAILEGKPIKVFNQGNMRRDFTYIDDVIEGMRRVMDLIPQPDPAWSGDTPDPGTSIAPYRIYNIGNHTPVDLMAFIALLEVGLGQTAQKEMLPMQSGDVAETYADVDDLARDVGFSPQTPLKDGIARFLDWLNEYRELVLSLKQS
ncbi:MAG: NAD-dependent epimerase [Hyphomicrobiales bacterium]|nr:NAD-dependent epimerase [Hyphomicrobiales bacterium]